MNRSAHACRGPLWHAAESAICGFLFSVVTAAVIVAGLALNFIPFKSLERRGVDLGMRLYTNLGLTGAERSPATQSLKYVFIDVDPAACRAFLAGAPDIECQTRNPVRTALLTNLVASLQRTPARVVIVDVAPPERAMAGELASWRAAMTSGTGPWIIAPLVARPAETADGSFLLRSDPIDNIDPGLGTGRMRLASFIAWQGEGLSDGVQRHYGIATRLELPGGGVRWVPTAPYLAAALALDATAADRLYADALASSQLPSTTCDDARPPADANSCAAHEFRSQYKTEKTPRELEFFYSLPSESSLAAHEIPKVRGTNQHIYNRYQASALLVSCPTAPQSKCFDLIPELFTDAVVVVGSSLIGALDRTQTPVGPMSGAEVIINATRAFAEFKTPQMLSTWTQFRTKASALLLPSLILFFAWWLIHSLDQATTVIGTTKKAPSLRSFRERSTMIALRCVGIPLIFIIAMLVCLFIEAQHMTANLVRVHDRAESIDLLLPVLALGVEGFVVVAVLIHASFERAASWFLAAMQSLWNSFLILVRRIFQP